MAAGIGSRYSRGESTRLKQLESVGPHGESILDYSVWDALRAGFERVVVVLRPEIRDLFDREIGDRLADHVELVHAYQEIDSAIPPGIDPDRLGERSKPWGTAHAALVAAPHVPGACAIINADDFYGGRSIALLAEALRGAQEQEGLALHHLVGYPLQETLSAAGPVSRGVCRTDPQDMLKDLLVTPSIEPDPEVPNGVRYRDEDGAQGHLRGDLLASMNLWGFSNAIFPALDDAFTQFLEEVTASDDCTSAEIGLPSVVLSELSAGRIRVRVHRALDRWLGITHPQDLEAARSALAELTSSGVYPAPLWS